MWSFPALHQVASSLTLAKTRARLHKVSGRQQPLATRTARLVAIAPSQMDSPMYATASSRGNPIRSGGSSGQTPGTSRRRPSSSSRCVRFRQARACACMVQTLVRRRGPRTRRQLLWLSVEPRRGVKRGQERRQPGQVRRTVNDRPTPCATKRCSPSYRSWARYMFQCWAASAQA
jgi:hypothetical protein